MLVYLVKDLDTGLFSTGGMSPKWAGVEHAKRWKAQNHASAHIRQCCGHSKDIKGHYAVYYKQYAEFRKTHPNLAIIKCEIRIEEASIVPYVYD